MTDPAPNARTIHASCVVLGETGILIRGASGSGKSSLALRLVARRDALGGFARLVADDRVILSRAGDRIVARPHPDLAGLIEVRGLGLRRAPYEPAAIVGLVVDLVDKPPTRMPETHELTTELLGISFPRIAAPRDEATLMVEAALGSGIFVAPMTRL